MKLVEIKKEDFNSLVKCEPNLAFNQSSNWADLKALTGWKAKYVGYVNDSGIYQAFAMILLRKMPLIKSYMAYCPRGYLINFFDSDLLHNFHNDLVEYLRKEHCFELIIDPYFEYAKRDIDGKPVDDINNQRVVDDLISLGYRHTGFNLNYENLQPRWLFRLNIKGKTYEELEKDFRYEAKRRSRKKDFLGINVRELSRDEIPVFKDLMNSTSKRRGFIDRSIDYYYQMYDAMHDDNMIKYMVAEIDTEKCRKNVSIEIDKQEKKIAKLNERPEKNKGRIKEEEVTLNSHKNLLEQLNRCEEELGKVAPLSAVCLLIYGKEAIMLLAGNNEDYLQHFNTSNIIVSELIKYCQSLNLNYYNFYGISGDFNPENEGYGLYLYKRQYGGEVMELIGQFEYTINSFMKSLYEFLLRIYKLTKRV